MATVNRGLRNSGRTASTVLIAIELAVRPTAQTVT